MHRPVIRRYRNLPASSPDHLIWTPGVHHRRHRRHGGAASAHHRAPTVLAPGLGNGVTAADLRGIQHHITSAWHHRGLASAGRSFITPFASSSGRRRAPIIIGTGPPGAASASARIASTARSASHSTCATPLSSLSGMRIYIIILAATASLLIGSRNASGQRLINQYNNNGPAAARHRHRGIRASRAFTSLAQSAPRSCIQASASGIVSIGRHQAGHTHFILFIGSGPFADARH